LAQSGTATAHRGQAVTAEAVGGDVRCGGEHDRDGGGLEHEGEQQREEGAVAACGAEGGDQSEGFGSGP
jgi:hypothetical protein